MQNNKIKKEMEDKTDKYLKEIVKEIKLESPSKDFTENVMKKIALEGKTVSETKSSIFEKYKFIFIFSVTFISIFLIVFFFTDYQDPILLNKLKFDYSGISLLEKLRDFFSINITFSSVYLILPVSVFLLFSLDYLIPRLNNKNII